MAIIRSLKSGDFKKSEKWRFYGVLKVATLRSLKSGDFKAS